MMSSRRTDPRRCLNAIATTKARLCWTSFCLADRSPFRARKAKECSSSRASGGNCRAALRYATNSSNCPLLRCDLFMEGTPRANDCPVRRLEPVRDDGNSSHRHVAGSCCARTGARTTVASCGDWTPVTPGGPQLRQGPPRVTAGLWRARDTVPSFGSFLHRVGSFPSVASGAGAGVAHDSAIGRSARSGRSSAARCAMPNGLPSGVRSLATSARICRTAAWTAWVQVQVFMAFLSPTHRPRTGSKT